MIKQRSIGLYAFIVCGSILHAYVEIPWLQYIFKPLIMVWIAGYFLSRSAGIPHKLVKAMLLAFTFSWFGDILLMFTGANPLFFEAGLSAFLISQLCYIVAFNRSVASEPSASYLSKHPYWLTVFLLVGILFGYQLFPVLGTSHKIAVSVYAMAILSMSAMALNRKETVSTLSFRLVFFGSLIFILSDALIAINKFLAPISHAGILIMGTYAAAQLLIMMGILKQFHPH